MKMMNTWFFVVCLVTSVISHTVDSMHSTSKEDLELETQLNILNKSPIKSIHTKSGYIVDCVDINKQPAFDNPLLKNHKLQRKPSFKNGEASMEISSTKPIYGLEKVICPNGTVPIKRTTKDDLIRGKSLFNNHLLTQNGIRSQYANMFTKTPGTGYYGVKGTTSVYNPKVSSGQISSSRLYVRKGEGDDINQIEVGWHVAPELYNGDDATYFYSMWTSGNFKTGCYNTLCSGFIQTNESAFHPGERISNTSTYDGEMLEMPIYLFQDTTSQNWWLAILDTTIGYFPAELFSNLVTGNNVGWGGSTTTPDGVASPPMGSGHFPDENYSHACYFRNISFQTKNRIITGPDFEEINYYNDAPKCYNIEYYGDEGGNTGYSLQFGGPGGDCDN